MAVIFQYLLMCIVISVTVSVVYGQIAIVKSIEDFPSSQCGQGDPLQNKELQESLTLVPNCLSTVDSCQAILRCNSSATSGYYMIQATKGSSVQVYCDMEGTNCGGEGGWMRVAYLDMTDPSNQCPNNFLVRTINNKRFCIRNTIQAVCRGMSFQTLGFSYSQVCGYVRGYAQYSVDGFGQHGRGPNVPLSGNYVDGVSITYGSPPSHVWTYVAGVEENAGAHPTSSCPCNSNININNLIPSYVGNDYYCEAGAPTFPNANWHTNDPLWDGQQCGGTEGPCCNIPGLPWFNKNISSPTTDSIEVRLCADENNSENIGVENVELYIK